MEWMLFCAGRGTAETRPSRETGHARSIELPAAELSASGLKGSAGTACRSRNLSLCLGTPAELGKKIARAPVPSKRFPVRVPNPRRRSAACQCGDGKEKGSQRTKRKEKASFELTERVAFVRVFFKSPRGLVRFPRVFPEPGRGPENASPIAAFPAA